MCPGCLKLVAHEMEHPVVRRGWGVYEIIPWSPPTLTFSNMVALCPPDGVCLHLNLSAEEK